MLVPVVLLVPEGLVQGPGAQSAVVVVIGGSWPHLWRPEVWGQALGLGGGERRGTPAEASVTRVTVGVPLGAEGVGAR